MIKLIALVEFFDEDLKKAMNEASEKSLLKCGALVEKNMKKLLNVGGGKARTPSTPPKPPHKQTGTLQSSVHHALVKNKDGSRTVIVGPTNLAPYGAVHEYGLEVNGRNYPKRPFAKPALNMSRSEFPNMFKNVNLKNTKAGRKMEKKGRIK